MKKHSTQGTNTIITNKPLTNSNTSMGTTNNTFPLNYYTVTIGILGGKDEFAESINVSPMLPDWDTYLKIRQDLIAAGLFDEDDHAQFDNLEQAIETLQAYLTTANPDRFDDFTHEEEEIGEEELGEEDF